MVGQVRLTLMAGILALLSAGSAAAAPQKPPVVIELFTAQGCPSCPTAEEFVSALSSRPDVLALTFGVPLWGTEGGRDALSQPAFVDRQYGYSESLRRGFTFTPQVIVDGRDETSGNDRDGIGQMIQAHEAPDAPNVTLAGDRVQIGAGRRPADPADVWLVYYDPHVIEVPARPDLDTGRTLPHKNVVRAISRIGAWQGRAETLTIAAPPTGLASAVLIQTAGLGPILAAGVGPEPKTLSPEAAASAALAMQTRLLHTPGRAGRVVHHRHA